MKKKLTEGIDFYYTGEGFIVLTASYHLERGNCCGNGCRHCPYEYCNVPEQQKNILLKEKHAASNKEET